MTKSKQDFYRKVLVEDCEKAPQSIQSISELIDTSDRFQIAVSLFQKAVNDVIAERKAWEEFNEEFATPERDEREKEEMDKNPTPLGNSPEDHQYEVQRDLDDEDRQARIDYAVEDGRLDPEQAEQMSEAEMDAWLELHDRDFDPY